MRVVSTFAVVILHVAAQNWYSTDVTSAEWHVLNFYDSMVRWAVPVFVMISGALFLDRHRDIRKLYTKNIRRIGTAFLLGSVGYVLYYILVLKREMGAADIIKEIFEGSYHMWFCFMIIGLYMITPLLREIVKSDEMLRYFLVLSFLYTFAFPRLNFWVSLHSGATASIISGILQKTDLRFVCGYVFYFVCGYYLNKTPLSVRQRWIIYILGICGFVGTILLTAWISVNEQAANTVFYDYFTINVLLESLCVYTAFKYFLLQMRRNRRLNDWIHGISKYCFGVYIVHIMVISEVGRLGGGCNGLWPAVFEVPLTGLLVFVISMFISGIIHHARGVWTCADQIK